MKLFGKEFEIKFDIMGAVIFHVIGSLVGVAAAWLTNNRRPNV